MTLERKKKKSETKYLVAIYIKENNLFSSINGTDSKICRARL